MPRQPTPNVPSASRRLETAIPASMMSTIQHFNESPRYLLLVQPALLTRLQENDAFEQNTCQRMAGYLFVLVKTQFEQPCPYAPWY